MTESRESAALLLNEKAGQSAEDLVFGAAVGYRLEQVLPFLSSLLKTGYEGRIVLMVDAALSIQIEQSEFHAHVMTHVVPQWLPFKYKLHKGHRKYLLGLWWPFRYLLWLCLKFITTLSSDPEKLASIKRKIADRLMPPTETRYLHALQIVREGNYRRVLLSDVRDVIFQANPFASIADKPFVVGMETYPESLKLQHHNANWIKRAYDRATLDKIGDNPISCCGVSYGSGASMKAYLTEMATEIQNIKFRATSAPLDQAFHNLILWSDRLSEVEFSRTGVGQIATLSDKRDLDAIDRDTDGILLNKKAEVISILHMYDRWPELKSAKLAQLR